MEETVKLRPFQTFQLCCVRWRLFADTPPITNRSHFIKLKTAALNYYQAIHIFGNTVKYVPAIQFSFGATQSYPSIFNYVLETFRGVLTLAKICLSLPGPVQFFAQTTIQMQLQTPNRSWTYINLTISELFKALKAVEMTMAFCNKNKKRFDKLLKGTT